MKMRDHANDILRAINDEREQIGDIAAEDAHVQGIGIGERSEIVFYCDRYI